MSLFGSIAISETKKEVIRLIKKHIEEHSPAFSQDDRYIIELYEELIEEINQIDED